MATSDQVQQLYITYFGRPADPSGLAYWTADEETPLSVIADGFATTPEFSADIEGLTLDQIVNSFYVDLFGRNAEPGGLAFWVNQIQIGNTTIQQVGLEISSTALLVQNTGNADNIALNAKIDAADQWTSLTAASTEATLAYTGQAGIDAGFNYLVPVLTQATIPSEVATQAQIDQLIATNGGGPTETLQLSVQQDVADGEGTVRLDANGTVQATSSFKFTASNQIVNGTVNTFSGVVSNDILTDGFTTDEDVLNVTGVTDLATFGEGGIAANAASVTNIENINIELVNGDNTFVNTGIVGAQTFTVTGTIAAADAGFNLNTAATGADTFIATALTASASAARFAVTAENGIDSTITTGETRDSLVGGTGNDTLSSGAGIDTLVGGLGVDQLTGGAGADVFQMSNMYNAATLQIDIDTVTDFGIDAGDTVGTYSLADLLPLATLVNLDDSDDVAAGDALNLTLAAINAFDLAGATANSNLLIATGNYANVAALQADVRTIIANGAWDADEGFLIGWDNGADSFIGLVETNGAVADNAAFALATVSTLTTLEGVSNSALITNANLSAFVA